MIYEARPSVTIDAFALCFKAGNASILKGGREAGASNAALAGIAHEVLDDHKLPCELLTIVTTSCGRADRGAGGGVSRWLAIGSHSTALQDDRMPSE